MTFEPNSKLNTQSINRLVFATSLTLEKAAGLSDEHANNVLSKLLELNIIGAPIANVANCYSLADSFMQHIIFMGCSPAIEFETPDVIDPEKLDFSFLRMHVVPKVVPFHGHHYPGLQQVPRCRECRRPVAADVAAFVTALSEQQQIQCDTCAAQGDVQALDWRKQTAWGNLFIEIFHVYPHEAVPTDGFLQHLTTASQTPWQYFYTAHDSQLDVIG